MTSTKALRPVDANAILHPSVYERFATKKVPQFYETKEYRPENLSNHAKLTQYYQKQESVPAAEPVGTHDVGH
jgi:hypothetical protein